MNIEQPKIYQNTDTTFLKTIAVIAMLSDHIGKCLFPDIIWFQVIGRIAFPIFAYCLVVGFLYTRDYKKYLYRMGLFFLISQPFHTLAFHPSWNGFLENIFVANIFLDLALGLIALLGIKERKWWLTIIACIATVFFNTTYGISGMLLMMSFYLFRTKNTLSFVIVGAQLLLPFFIGNSQPFLGYALDIQGFAVLSLPFIYIKTQFKPRIHRYFFYLFYPLHLAVLFIIRLIFKL